MSLTALKLNVISRVGYSIGTRMPGIFSYLSGTGKGGFFTKAKQIINEADYVLGDNVNFSIAKKFTVSPDIANIILNDGEKYRFVFEVKNVDSGITIPGNGIIHEEKSNRDLRIYKVSYSKPNKLNVDLEVMPQDKPKNSKVEKATMGVPVLLLVAAVAGAIAITIGGIYGYLALKEVHKILISPSGIIISIVLLLLLFPTLKSGVGKGIKSAVG